MALACSDWMWKMTLPLHPDGWVLLIFSTSTPASNDMLQGSSPPMRIRQHPTVFPIPNQLSFTRNTSTPPPPSHSTSKSSTLIPWRPRCHTGGPSDASQNHGETTSSSTIPGSLPMQAIPPLFHSYLILVLRAVLPLRVSPGSDGGPRVYVMWSSPSTSPLSVPVRPSSERQNTFWVHFGDVKAW